MIDIDSKEFSDRFWSRVQPAGDDQCWPWMRACQTKGYGQIYIGETAHRAHRMAFRLVHGKWPNVICHKCDNPICCNPRHLIDGTYQQNMEERSARGRHNCPKGEKSPSSKLTEEKVLAIRADHASGFTHQRLLAEKYGCSGAMVSLIVRRKNWTHI